MKSVKTVFARPIKVEENTSPSSPKDKWMRIRDANTREILHTGQPRYIKRVATKRYGHKIVG